MLKQKIRDLIATRLASLMRHFALDPRYFELWQSLGFHVKQVHFYSPLPDTGTLDDSLFGKASDLPGLDLNETTQIALLSDVSKNFRAEYSLFPIGKATKPGTFYFGNSSLESGDAEMLYGLIRKLRPQRVVEIGSVFSTLLAGQALALNRSEGAESSLVAIEPYPRSFLRDPLPFPVQLIENLVQEVPMETFTSLVENDILFIDSSHVCKIGSDVQFEFLEILPRLAPGVLVHVHDIFMPLEYPKKWVKEWHRFWNEQYILQAFLSGNHDFEIIWAGAWMQHHHPDLVEKAFPSFSSKRNQLASFWFRRRS
jgi:hypothetical protein